MKNSEDIKEIRQSYVKSHVIWAMTETHYFLSVYPHEISAQNTNPSTLRRFKIEQIAMIISQTHVQIHTENTFQSKNAMTPK
jgi:hypothetical protein